MVRATPPHPLARHLHHLFSLLQVDCVLDVGANRGQFAEFLRHDVRFEGHIVSFEPHPDLTPQLALAAERDPKWRVEPYALGRTASHLPFYLTEVTDHASLLEPNAFGRSTFGVAVSDRGKTEVPVQTLSSVLPDILATLGARRPFLKVDTQGYDLEVLAGARGVWDGLVGVMVEATLIPSYNGQPTLAESIDSVRSAGFDITGLYPGAGGPGCTLVEFDLVARRM